MDEFDSDIPREPAYPRTSDYMNLVVELPQQLILELAVGLESLPAICARYGIDADAAESLRENPLFQQAVAKAEAQLRREGLTFKLRAAHAAEDVLGDVWRRARGPDVTLPQKLEALRTLAKLADLEPRHNAQLPQAAGSGFSITINIPGQTPAAPSTPVHVIEDAVQEVGETRATPLARIAAKNQDLIVPDDYEG